MSTLCYRLNLVVSLGDVAHGKPCVSVVPSVDGTVASGAHCVIRCHLVDVTGHIMPRMPRVERAITLPVHQSALSKVPLRA